MKPAAQRSTMQQKRGTKNAVELSSGKGAIVMWT